MTDLNNKTSTNKASTSKIIASSSQTIALADIALTDKSLIIFDWDGTLMDSIGLIVESMHHAGQAHGYDATDAAIKDIIGLSLSRGIELVFSQASKAEQKAIEKSYGEYYISASSEPDNPHAKLFAGIEPMLQQLRTDGKLLAVATGKKRAGLNKLMQLSNSASYFVTSRCADESGSKPNPQMLIDILQETNKHVEDAVFIGDSVHDINMANALGMMSIAVNYGAGTQESLAQCNPTFQCDTPQQLIDLLTQDLDR